MALPFAIPTYFGTYIYDSNYRKVATLGSYGAPQPTGVAYAPVDPVAYFPWEGTSNVRVYDMRTFQQIGTYTFQDTFNFTNNNSFAQGHARVSRDGFILMVNVTGGISYVQLYAPLGADNVTASTAGKRVDITLLGHIGNNGTLTYGVQTPPVHGHVYIVGNTATYIPDPGYSGTDTFTYAAHYGQAVANATATINVTADTSAYNPTVSFHTLPVVTSAPIPGSPRIPGDFNGDGISDILWFNPGTSQLGYWTMTTASNGLPKRTGAHLYNITPGYFIGAAGDFDGDGYTDLVFTSSNHDLWLWTNTHGGTFHSTQIYSYPADWQLIGAGDINGDGKDDLLWLNPSTCQFAYWLMDGGKRIGARITFRWPVATTPPASATTPPASA